jgi:hypothetical protein
VLRTILGPKRDEVTGGWRKLQNLYYLPNIIRKTKSRRIRWAGLVARMGGRGSYRGYWWESQTERDHQENQDLGGWIILKWILDRMGWH